MILFKITSHLLLAYIDGIFDPSIAAVNAASLALMLSRQPWAGPIGCVRIGLIDGKLKVDPSVDEMSRRYAHMQIHEFSPLHLLISLSMRIEQVREEGRKEGRE